MDVEAALSDALKRLRSNRLTGEEQIKLAVILPVLRALEWDERDPNAFVPEYPVPNGRVDYALLVRSKPRVFVEAKRLGAMDEDARSQLFGYATNRGIPLLVLTDGKHWEFYLSMASGEPGERKFHDFRLDRRGDLAEYADFLVRHLGRAGVASGEAQRNAQDRLEVKREMPDAWRNLLEEADERLCGLLSKAVERECGVKPDEGHVRQFLSDRARDSLSGRMSLSGPSIADRGIREPVSTRSGRAKGRREQERPQSHGTLIGKPKYHRPTLRVLCDMGDGGVAGEVLERVRQLVEPELTDRDRDKNTSGVVRWQHAVYGALNKLKGSGLIEQDPVSKAYRITEKGREYLRS